MTDFDALRLTPIYAALAVDGVLVDRIGNQVDLRIIDKTAGTNVADGVTVNSIEPSADVRMTDLVAQGLATCDVDGCEITFNGKSWTIRTHFMRPGIGGETTGEVRFLLNEIA